MNCRSTFFVCLIIAWLFPVCQAFSIQGSDFQGDPQIDTKLKLLRKRNKFKFEKHGGIVYRQTETYKLKCDIYQPKGDGPFPVIVAMHGGAWRSGTKFVMLRHAWLAAQHGYVVMAINYRHAPEHKFPAQVHDCKSAVRWIKANAKKYNVDLNRVGAFGYSAGGHLALMLGTTDAADSLEGNILPEHAAFNSNVQAVVAGGAPCEFSWIGMDSRVLTYWLGGTRRNASTVYTQAAPTSYVTPNDAPAMLFHGDGDLIVPKSSSEKMYAAFNRNGVTCYRYIVQSNGHLGTFSDLSWMERAVVFFDEHLKPTRHSEQAPKLK